MEDTLFPGRERDAPIAPIIVVRRAGGVLQRGVPGDNSMVRDDCPDQYHVEGMWCIVGKDRVCGATLLRMETPSMRRSILASYLSLRAERAKKNVSTMSRVNRCDPGHVRVVAHGFSSVFDCAAICIETAILGLQSTVTNLSRHSHDQRVIAGYTQPTSLY